MNLQTIISKLVNMESLGDERGQLTVLEENKHIPFEFKRVFYIYGTISGVRRGSMPITKPDKR